MKRAGLKKLLKKHLPKRPKGVKLSTHGSEGLINYNPRSDVQAEYVASVERLAEEMHFTVWIGTHSEDPDE